MPKLEIVCEFDVRFCVSRLDGVVVDCAVTVVVDAAGVSTEQLDYLILQSNQVENSYREIKERPTVVYTITDVRDFSTEALHDERLESGKMTSAAAELHAL